MPSLKQHSESEMNITRQEAVDLIRNTGGKFFAVSVIKRTNNELTRLTARLGVNQFVTGAGLRYNPTAKNLISCWCANKDGGADSYRMINVPGIVSLAISGIEYTVV